MKTHHIFYRRVQGAAAVEFAILLVPLLLLVCGVTEFGRAIYQYEVLTKTTRDAARFLSQYSASDQPNYNTNLVPQAQCLAVYGNTTCTGSVLVSGLTSSMVVVCDSFNSTGCSGTFANYATPGGTMNLVEVKITGFVYKPLESFLKVGNITFNDIATVMRQVL
jgi:Flp pilus assembly protein TadG